VVDPSCMPPMRAYNGKGITQSENGYCKRLCVLQNARTLPRLQEPNNPRPLPTHLSLKPGNQAVTGLPPRGGFKRLPEFSSDECAAFMLWRAAARCAWDSGRCCILRPGLALLRLLDKYASLYNIFQ
jgi:hypothetical protein